MTTEPTKNICSRKKLVCLKVIMSNWNSRGASQPVLIVQKHKAKSSTRPVVCLHVYTDSAVIGCWFSRWGGVETLVPVGRSLLMVSSGRPKTTQHTQHSLHTRCRPDRRGVWAWVHRRTTLTLCVCVSLLSFSSSRKSQEREVIVRGRTHAEGPWSFTSRCTCGSQGKYKTEFLLSFWWFVHAKNSVSFIVELDVFF